MQPADALDRVAEAREAMLRTWGDPARLSNAIAAFESAVRAAERARLRGLVEGMPTYFRPHDVYQVSPLVSRESVIAALDTILSHLGAPSDH